MGAPDSQGSSGGEYSDTGQNTDISVLRVSSGWVEFSNGTWVRMDKDMDRSWQRSTTSRPFQESWTTDVLRTDSGWVLWSNGTWVRESSWTSTEASVQDNTGWIRLSDGTFVRRTSSWSSWTSTSSRSRSRSSTSALDPSDVVETSRAEQNQGWRSDPGSTPHCEDYEELSPHCNNVGTYNCGACLRCPSDFFGVNCECSAEAIPFGFNLEDGCR